MKHKTLLMTIKNKIILCVLFRCILFYSFPFIFFTWKVDLVTNLSKPGCQLNFTGNEIVTLASSTPGISHLGGVKGVV